MSIRTPRFFNIIFIICFVASISSCKVYKRGIILDTEGYQLQAAKKMAEDNYTFKKFDQFNISVFTQNGERLIDPDFELVRILNEGTGAGRQGLLNQGQDKNTVIYDVRANGETILPMIGNINLEGKTIYEAQLVLQEKFSEFYQKPLVKITFVNKRVFVLGTVNMVVPLPNENTKLFEVLASSGAISLQSNAHKVRVIRGNPQNPEVFEINLASVNGMKDSMIDILPNDVIYIEPIVRPIIQGVRDTAPFISIITSSIALWLAIRSLSGSNNN